MSQPSRCDVAVGVQWSTIRVYQRPTHILWRESSYMVVMWASLMRCLSLPPCRRIQSSACSAYPQSFATVKSHRRHRFVIRQSCEQLLGLALVGGAVYNVLVRHVQGVAVAYRHVAAPMQRSEASCVHVEASYAFRA
jgi:hypothetical protein